MGRTTTAVISLFLVLLSSVISDATDAEVQIDVISKPDTCDRAAKNGDRISMKYKGNLYDVATKELGKQFDSNVDSAETFDFKLGAGQVIPGWEAGVPGMCVGEKRKLTVPPELAYGDQGFTDLIPPKSTLVFEIELVDLKEGELGHDHDGDGVTHNHKEDTFGEMDANGDKQITAEEMAGYIKKFNDVAPEADKLENIDVIVDEIFKEDDKDKDGVISVDEYMEGYQLESDDNAKDEL